MIVDNIVEYVRREVGRCIEIRGGTFADFSNMPAPDGTIDAVVPVPEGRYEIANLPFVEIREDIQFDGQVNLLRPLIPALKCACELLTARLDAFAYGASYLSGRRPPNALTPSVHLGVVKVPYVSPGDTLPFTVGYLATGKVTSIRITFYVARDTPLTEPRSE